MISDGPVAAIGAIFAAAVRRDGLEPDPRLRLLVPGGPPGTDAADRVGPVEGPGDLGPRYESLLVPADRTAAGVWYTPAWLAAELVARALPDPSSLGLGRVVDPTCGGGVFLLAAAERLVALGATPAHAVAVVTGGDLDAGAVAVAEAALWWWAARRGAVTEPADLVVGDTLLGRGAGDTAWGGAVAAVVGNPPFLGQLRSRTAADAARRRALRARFGATVGAYTDPAWLYLVAAVDWVVPGGRVVLVEPQSVLGARDAAPVRAAVDRIATLDDCVIDDGSAFGGLAVCAPVLRRRVQDPATGVARHERNDWLGSLATSRGVPPVTIGDPAPSGGTVARLGDVATCWAGFRDEYYGLVDAVADGGGGPRLVTAGAIDPLQVLDRSQRFAGRRWDDPRVDAAATSGRAARWVGSQAVPKLLVATQTKVVEVVADPDGRLVGSVPVVCVAPHDPDRLWHLLAALHAPAVSAWMLRATGGTALSSDACKPTARILADVPLPPEGAAWDVAASATRAAATRAAGAPGRTGATPDDVSGRIDDAARLADLAYGIDDPALYAWWLGRRPFRPI